jgi:hypothetical protein
MAPSIVTVQANRQLYYRTLPCVLAAEPEDPNDFGSDYWQVVSAFYKWRTVTEAKLSLSSILDAPNVHPSVVVGISHNLRNFDAVLAAALARGAIETA